MIWAVIAVVVVVAAWLLVNWALRGLDAIGANRKAKAMRYEEDEL